MISDGIGCYWDGLQSAVSQVRLDTIAEAVETLFACYSRNGTIFVAGNGGSAATASHFACDLAKGARTQGARPFRCVPLTDNVPLLTAWANDVSYAHIFAEQLRPLMRSGDVLVAISASGNSPNIIAAVEVAIQMDATCLALTGRTGGRLGHMADVVVKAPTASIEQVEDIHLMVAHCMCVTLRERLHANVSKQLHASLVTPQMRALRDEPIAHHIKEEDLVTP